eukprot:Hpha_TRINITY_DN11162_c0_g1::TRINITY_DN11162_c0_g1_i1::g.28108::m.28108
MQGIMLLLLLSNQLTAINTASVCRRRRRSVTWAVSADGGVGAGALAGGSKGVVHLPEDVLATLELVTLLPELDLLDDIRVLLLRRLRVLPLALHARPQLLDVLSLLLLLFVRSFCCPCCLVGAVTVVRVGLGGLGPPLRLVTTEPLAFRELGSLGKLNSRLPLLPLGVHECAVGLRELLLRVGLTLSLEAGEGFVGLGLLLMGLFSVFLELRESLSQALLPLVSLSNTTLGRVRLTLSLLGLRVTPLDLRPLLLHRTLSISPHPRRCTCPFLPIFVLVLRIRAFPLRVAERVALAVHNLQLRLQVTLRLTLVVGSSPHRRRECRGGVLGLLDFSLGTTRRGETVEQGVDEHGITPRKTAPVGARDPIRSAGRALFEEIVDSGIVEGHPAGVDSGLPLRGVDSEVLVGVQPLEHFPDLVMLGRLPLTQRRRGLRRAVRLRRRHCITRPDGNSGTAVVLSGVTVTATGL